MEHTNDTSSQCSATMRGKQQNHNGWHSNMCYLSLGKINDTCPKCRIVFWIIPIQTSGDGHHLRDAIINVIRTRNHNIQKMITNNNWLLFWAASISVKKMSQSNWRWNFKISNTNNCDIDEIWKRDMHVFVWIESTIHERLPNMLIPFDFGDGDNVVLTMWTWRQQQLLHLVDLTATMKRTCQIIE